MIFMAACRMGCRKHSRKRKGRRPVWRRPACARLRSVDPVKTGSVGLHAGADSVLVIVAFLAGVLMTAVGHVLLRRGECLGRGGRTGLRRCRKGGAGECKSGT